MENPTVVYPRKAIGLINTGKAFFDRSGTGLAKELAKGELKLKVSFTMYGEGGRGEKADGKCSR